MEKKKQEILIDTKWCRRRQKKKEKIKRKSANVSLILTHHNAIKASHFACSALYFRAISTLEGGEQDEAAMTTAGDLLQKEKRGGGRSITPPTLPHPR